MKRQWLWLIVMLCALLFPSPGFAQTAAKPGQTVEFRLEPKTAVLEVDGRPLATPDGVARVALEPGRHSYVVSAEDHHMKTDEIEVGNSSGTLVIEVPLMYSVGWLRLEGPDVVGAEVFVDRLPVDVADGKPVRLSGGLHTLKINRPRYDFYEDEITIVEGETTVFAPDMHPQLARTYVNVADGDAEIWLNGEKVSRTGIWCAPLPKGKYVIEARRPGYLPVRKEVKISSEDEERHFNFTLRRSLVKPTDLYVELGASVGGCMSADFTLGFNVRNFNVEGFYSLGLKSSPPVYWVPGDNAEWPRAEGGRGYHANAIAGGKIGYGFLAGSRFKITPQVGAKLTYFQQTNTAYDLYCLCATIGVRGYMALSRRFGISVTPEYGFGVWGNRYYKPVSEICSQVKNMAEGFNVKLALVMCF